MKQMKDEKAIHVLREAGFTVSEITRLIQLRRDYTASKQGQTSLMNPLLRFGRWYMRTMQTEESMLCSVTPSLYRNTRGKRRSMNRKGAL